MRKEQIREIGPCSRADKGDERMECEKKASAADFIISFTSTNREQNDPLLLESIET